MYDNFGVDAVWEQYKTVFVSDASAPRPESRRASGYFSGARAAVAIAMSTAAPVQRRQLLRDCESGVMDGAVWSTEWARVPDVAQQYGEEASAVIAAIRTDMDTFSDAEAAILENHGYLQAAYALRYQFLPPRPLTPPHPEWLDDLRVIRALKRSGKRILLRRALKRSGKRVLLLVRLSK